jgi:uncharacterized repeat protein (TIGR01451 family)
MFKKIIPRVAKVSLLGILASFFIVVSPADAAVSGVTLDFAAAEPTSYNHVTGGGAWNDGTINKDIRRSLEGENFACEDVVSYLTKVTIDSTTALSANGQMTMDLTYRYDLAPTGQTGVALGVPTSAILNASDSANTFVAPNIVTLETSTTTGPIYVKPSELVNTVRVTGVQSGEQFVIRTDVIIHCQAGASPTGNLQARLAEGFLIKINGSTTLNPSQSLNTGDQTVPLKKVEKVGKPILVISKTVNQIDQACPGVEYISIEPDDFVRYCYIITNPSNVGRTGAPLYNLSQIFDDHGQYPDFTVSITSGLTDIDGDGQIDDLAPGATAYAEALKSYDGNKDDLVVDVATVYGDDAPTSGTQLSASDTATVFIDAPAIAPAIAINKVTNGSDSATILVGQPVTWTYTVTNTGNVPLSAVTVTDNRGVSVSCPDTVIAVAETLTCTATGTASAGAYTNIGTAEGHYETMTVTATDPSGYFGADPKIAISKTPDTQTVIEGQVANFSISVTNTGNVPLTGVAVTDPLAPGCAATKSTLAVAENWSYSCSSPTVIASFINLASVIGYYDTTSVTSSDTASVTIDYLPKIDVTKVAAPTEVLETGGNVTFTVTVYNLAPEAFTLNSLVDDKFGNLNGKGNCATGAVIGVGGNYSCTFTSTLASDLRTPHTNIVTAGGNDPEGHPTSDTATATVTFTDVKPDISLSKKVNPTAVRSTGGYVDYTLRISNLTLETVTVTALADTPTALSAGCNALIGQQIAPLSYLECTIPQVWVSGPAGAILTNTATTTASDNEGNFDTDTATAVVKFWWYGRTPGFWKNHPESWKSGFTPGQFVQDVFAIPADLMPGGILNLDGKNGKDTLIDALAYKGGSKLQGAAQIFLRAAVAALLNEAYYGADYPAANSTGELRTKVEDVLKTLNRSEYLVWASYYDFWNNGVEGPLP